MISTTIPWESAQPPAEETTATMSPRETRATDVSRLNFPLQFVIMVVGAALAAYGAVWQANTDSRQTMAELRGEIRLISTQLEYQGKLWDERFAAMKDKAAVEAQLREALLKQYEKANTDFQNKVLRQQ